MHRHGRKKIDYELKFFCAAPISTLRTCNVSLPTMSQRLLSLLTIIEAALRKNDPNATHAMEATRTVNFQNGLCRLVLTDSTGSHTRGSFDVQSYLLADGETCVKVALAWGEAPAKTIISLFPKKGYDWDEEASKIARVWLTGAQAKQRLAAPVETAPSLSAAG